MVDESVGAARLRFRLKASVNAPRVGRVQTFMHRIGLATLFFLLSGLQPLAAESQVPASNTCYVVSYDHGGLVLWGYDHFLEHFRELLRWLDRHPKLRMGLDNEAWMYDWLAENQPAVLEEMNAALNRYQGRLAIGSCNYGQPLAAWLTEESNVRQIGMGLATVRARLGYDVSVYSWSEHAGYAQLPQVLAGFGFRGVLMRTHFLMYGYCPGYDLPVAWWQGPDGSRISCVPTYVHQERQVPSHRAQPPGPFGLTTEDTWILTRYPSPESPASLDTFRARFSRIQPLVASRIDDSGLKREALVSELDPRGDYEWVTLEGLFDKLPPPAETIAPSAEDFGTRMPWAYRGNELFDLSRRAEIAVLTAERLLARAAWSLRGRAQGDETTGLPKEALQAYELFDLSRRAEIAVLTAERLLARAAWSLKGRAQGDETTGLSKEALHAYEQDLRQAWKDLLVGQHHDIQIVSRSGPMGRELLLSSLERSRHVIRELLNSWVGKAAAGPADHFVAFNPLAWPRTEGFAELPDGTLLEGPVTAPSLGFGAFRCSTAPLAAQDGLKLVTDHYEASFSTKGGLLSLSTRQGKPVLRVGPVSGGLAGVIDGQHCESTGAVKILRGPAGFHVQETGKVGPLPYTLRWFFPAHGKRVECRIAVRFSGERIGAPTTQRNDSRSCFLHEQKLRLRVYPALDTTNAFGLRDVPFGVSKTGQPYVEGIHWTALGDDSGGLGIANRGTMGSVREPDGSFSVPLAFTTDYIWGAELLSGQREWAVALIPWEGELQTADLNREALEFAFPVVAVPGVLDKPSEDFLRQDKPGLNLTALYLEGGHGYARLFNGTDREQSTQWNLPGQSAPTPVDLRHRDLPGAPAKALRPWQFQTYRLW